MLKRFNWKWLRAEVNGQGEPFFLRLGDDMQHFQSVRGAVRKCFQSLEPEQITAKTWIGFLKPRVEALDYWANLITSIGAVLAAGFVLLSVLGQARKPADYVYAGVGAVIALLVATYKFEIDRRKSWYKYLIAHLEAVKDESAK